MKVHRNKDSNYVIWNKTEFSYHGDKTGDLKSLYTQNVIFHM